ncbi:hypothetical protein FGIG_10237 [Fasciola gigantica]|uniref:Uncharacterized protein n=1 Tax=Fasciola gigantica TaxID=46835 RepID=A0A504YBJ9_FASGI|nr:hypothetical protein FGIG_10237 [Fasciola gigantica]
MRDKHLTTCKAQSDCVKLRIDNEDKFDHFCSKPKVRTLFHDQSAGLMDRGDFNSWVERWRCVNAEFLARSLIHLGSTVGMHASEMTQHLPANSMDVLNRPSINSRKQIPATQIRPQFQSSELHQTPTIEGVCMRTLKSMYFSLISKPLSVLQKGLRDVRYQVKSELVQSNVVAKTLRELDRILGDSDSLPSSRDNSDLELSSFSDRRKCNA